MEDEVVQYFIVNTDVQMSTGKVAAQVAHAETLFMYDLLLTNQEGLEKTESFSKWINGSMTKIVLGTSEKNMSLLAAQNKVKVYSVIDEGRTELPWNTLTVICLPPMSKSAAREFVGKFRLYS